MSPSHLAVSVAISLLALLIVGAIYLVRKHGGWKNAIYGGAVELAGEVAVGTLKHGDAEFRISTVIKPNGSRLVLFRMRRSDSDGYPTTTFTITANQSLMLARILERASTGAKP